MQKYEIFFIDNDGEKNVVGESWLSKGLPSASAFAVMFETHWRRKYDGTNFHAVVAQVVEDEAIKGWVEGLRKKVLENGADT